MKKFFYFVVAAVTMLAVSSCNEKGPNGEDNASIKIEINEVGADHIYVTTTVENTESPYFCIYISEDGYRQVTERYSTDKALCQYFVEYLDNVIESYAAMNISATYMDFLEEGNLENALIPQLTPGTHYYFLAAFFDEEAKPLNNVVYKAEFTTEALSSDIRFEFAENNGQLTITPSNNDPFFYATYPAEFAYAFDYTAEEYTAEMFYYMNSQAIGQVDLSAYTYTGVQTLSWADALSEWEEVLGYAQDPSHFNISIVCFAVSEYGAIISTPQQYEWYGSINAAPAQKAAKIMPLQIKSNIHVIR